MAPLVRVTCIPYEVGDDSLCLYRDGRLDSRRVDSLWLRGDAGEYAPSELRRREASGAIVAVHSMAPLATLDSLRIRERRWALLTEDMSAGFGSYSGPVTHLVDLSRRAGIAEVRDHRGAEIVLTSTLKTAWKGQPDGFLMAACRPGNTAGVPDSIDFTTTYTRYRWSSGVWVRTERREPGFHEFEDGFPDVGMFPK